MRFLADESVCGPIVERLRQEGHSVAYIAELYPGAPDSYVLAQANQEGVLLITADRDFGEMVYQGGHSTQGVILIRLRGLSALEKARIVAQGVAEHGVELLNAFTVIAPGVMRIRRLH